MNWFIFIFMNWTLNKFLSVNLHSTARFTFSHCSVSTPLHSPHLHHQSTSMYTPAHTSLPCQIVSVLYINISDIRSSTIAFFCVRDCPIHKYPVSFAALFCFLTFYSFWGFVIFAFGFPVTFASLTAFTWMTWFELCLIAACESVLGPTITSSQPNELFNRKLFSQKSQKSYKQSA